MAAIAATGFGGRLAIAAGDSNIYGHSLIVAAICLLVAFIVTLFVQLISIACIEQQVIWVLHTWPPFCYFLLFGIVFHSISYASSSFIEEEHQTWYYLTSTALIALYAMETRSMLQSSNDVRDETAVNIRSRQLRWILLFVAHLIARRLNQTGDKWLMQPDIGDWLTLDECRLWNSLFVIASLCCLFLNCVDFGSILTNVLTLTALVLVYYFRTIGGFVHFAGIKKSE